MSKEMESIRRVASRLFSSEERMPEPTLIVHPNEDPRVRAMLEARGHKLIDQVAVTEADLASVRVSKEFKLARKKS